MEDFNLEGRCPSVSSASVSDTAQSPATDSPPKCARKSISRLGFALAAFLVASQLVSDLIYLFVPFICPALLDADWFYWAVHVFSFYVVGLSLFLLLAPYRTLPMPPKEKTRLSFGRVCFLFCISMFFAQAGLAISNLITIFFSVFGFSGLEDPTSTIFSTSSPLLTFLVAVIIGPIVEEIVFRRFVLRVLVPYGERAAILLSGLIFGLIHGNIQQFFYTAAFGFLLAYVYIRTGRLRYPILLHMLFNFFGGFVPSMLQSLLPLDALMEGTIVGEQWLSLLLPLSLYLIYTTLLIRLPSIAGVVFFIIGCRKTHFTPPVYPLASVARERAFVRNGGMILFFVTVHILLIVSLF